MLITKDNLPPFTDSQLINLYEILTPQQKVIVIRKLRRLLARASRYFYQRARCGRIGSPYGIQYPLAVAPSKSSWLFHSRLNGEYLKGRVQSFQSEGITKAQRSCFRRVGVYNERAPLKAQFGIRSQSQGLRNSSSVHMYGN